MSFRLIWILLYNRGFIGESDRAPINMLLRVCHDLTDVSLEAASMDQTLDNKSTLRYDTIARTLKLKVQFMFL